jgi:hypothetical protein
VFPPPYPLARKTVLKGSDLWRYGCIWDWGGEYVPGAPWQPTQSGRIALAHERHLEIDHDALCRTRIERAANGVQ